MTPLMRELFEQVHAYDLKTSKEIRLIPTEGLMSPMQKLMYLSFQHERYLHAPPENHDKAIRYPDIQELQAVYQLCREVAAEVLDAKHVLPDYLSGMNAMDIMLKALTRPGDLVLTVDSAHGGHECTPKILADLGRENRSLPFDLERHVIDAGRLDLSLSPALVYINHSNILYPHDLRAIKSAYPDAILVFDGSQIMGLIAGKTYPNPLADGADVLIGSTHKSLNGPQKALAATDSGGIRRILEDTNKVYVSNNHPADVAALAVCFIEAKEFGRQYARDLLANARYLADALIDCKVQLYPARAQIDLTSTQHVWIDCASMGWNAEAAVQVLYRAGIVVNTLYLGGGGPQKTGAKGLRLGTTELTRLGMGKQQMEAIAQSLASVLMGYSSPESVRQQMEGLRRPFQQVRYCYESPDDLESWFSKRLG